jgi:hypothetical protein
MLALLFAGGCVAVLRSLEFRDIINRRPPLMVALSTSASSLFGPTRSSVLRIYCRDAWQGVWNYRFALQIYLFEALLSFHHNNI